MNIVAATWADCAEINDLLSLCELNTGCASDLISDCLILRSGRLLVGAVQVQCIGSAALGCWLAVRPGFRRQGWGKNWAMPLSRIATMLGCILCSFTPKRPPSIFVR